MLVPSSSSDADDVLASDSGSVAEMFKSGLISSFKTGFVSSSSGMDNVVPVNS